MLDVMEGNRRNSHEVASRDSHGRKIRQGAFHNGAI